MSGESPVTSATPGGRGMPSIFGQYRIIRVLGHGGMGTVYEAEHLHLRRRVAIKTVSEGSITDPQALERFRREMEALGRLVHPNVVQAYDAGEIDGQRYLAMEFIDGVDVEAVATGFPALPIADCCEIVRQAALGLHHAHQNGLTHRDIKPKNLLLGRDGIVRVADLGLARIAGDKVPAITQSGNVMGTYDYIAPEQVAGEVQIGPRSDLYSLGCTLYRLLAGAPPFAAPEYDTPVRKLMAHVHASPPPIASVRPGVSPPIVELLGRLMAKDPARRPESAAIVADILGKPAEGACLADLLEFARSADGGIPTRSTAVYSALQTDGKATPVTGKRPGFWWKTVAVVIGFAGVGVFLWANRPGPRRDTPDRIRPVARLVAPPVAPPVETTEMTGNEPADVPGDERDTIDPEEGPGESRWHALLGGVLTPILWNRNSQSFIRMDRETDQIFLRTDGLGILGLGESARGRNTLQLDVQQLQWNGGFGVAVEAAQAADGSAQFVTIAILKNNGPNRKVAPLIAESKRIALRKSPLGAFVVAVAQPGSVRPLSDPGMESQLLEVRWDSTRITRVRWAGTDLSDLLYSLDFGEVAAAPQVHRFGVFVERTELTLSGARWLNGP